MLCIDNILAVPGVLRPAFRNISDRRVGNKLGLRRDLRVADDAGEGQHESTKYWSLRCLHRNISGSGASPTGCIDR